MFIISFDIKLTQWAIQRKLSICLYFLVTSNLTKLTFAAPSVTIAENLSEPISTKICSICWQRNSPVCFSSDKFFKEYKYCWWSDVYIIKFQIDIELELVQPSRATKLNKYYINVNSL